jgi:hypothetical protein
MLYEAITGRMPHAASSLPELALKVTTVDAASVKSLCPKVPSTLARLVDWSLARNRDDRIPNLKLLHDELELFAREHSFRGEMTLDNASIPMLAFPAQTAETLADSQLGVGIRIQDLHQADVTPPPAARTHREPRGAGGFNWLPWSLLTLTLLAFWWSHKPSSEPKRHAAAQPVLPASELAMLSLAAAPAAESGEPAVRVCAGDEVELPAKLAQAAQPEPMEALAAEATPQHKNEAAQPLAPAKIKSQKTHKPSAPAASEPTSPEASKRSIPKLLAF